MRERVTAGLLACGLILAGCSDSDTADESASTVALDGSTTTVAGNQTQVLPPTTAPDAVATTTVPATTDGSVATTAPPTTSGATTTLPESSTAVLKDGQPATWFGVRDDTAAGLSRVEERGTLDGVVRRELAQFAIGGEGEGWAPVSIDVSTDRLAFGMCCEPVSGNTKILRRIDGVDIVETFGSEPVFSPNPPHLVTVNYADGGMYNLVNSNNGVAQDLPVTADWGDRASWSLDGTMIAVEVGDAIAIVFFDPELGEAVDVSATFEPPAGTSWSKPAFQASGNLVVAQDADGGGNTLGVLLNKEVFGGLAGDVVLAEFQYEGEVIHQIYDDSGTFLIYVLDDGSVRWQGTGSRGELAPAGSGFLAAAW